MKVILLDRDGTLIRDPKDERVDAEEKIELFSDSLESLQYLADKGFSVIVISNQAGIAEGRITVEDFHRIHAKVLDMLSQSGVTILKTYFCPHSAEDNCDCRKPKPKLLLEAMREFNLTPADLFMVGDRESDVEAGINAGTKTILVQTANSRVTAEHATHTAPNLLEAVKYAVAHSA